MSKNHRDNSKAALADWTVLDPQGNQSVITQSRFSRDQHGGYTFTDSKGVTADFPPGTVMHVIRKEPVISEHGLRLDAEKLRRDRGADEYAGMDSRA